MEGKIGTRFHTFLIYKLTEVLVSCVDLQKHNPFYVTGWRESHKEVTINEIQEFIKKTYVKLKGSLV